MGRLQMVCNLNELLSSWTCCSKFSHITKVIISLTFFVTTIKNKKSALIHFMQHLEQFMWPWTVIFVHILTGLVHDTIHKSCKEEEPHFLIIFRKLTFANIYKLTNFSISWPKLEWQWKINSYWERFRSRDMKLKYWRMCSEST